MLPILQAEEVLIQVTAVAAGSGTLKNPKSILNQWQRQAQPRRPTKKMTKEQLKITALAMGLEVEER